MALQDGSPETSPDLAVDLVFNKFEAQDKPRKMSKKERKKERKNRKSKTKHTESDESLESSTAATSPDEVTSSEDSSNAVTYSSENSGEDASSAKAGNATADPDSQAESDTDNSDTDEVESSIPKTSSDEKTTTEADSSSDRLESSARFTSSDLDKRDTAEDDESSKDASGASPTSSAGGSGLVDSSSNETGWSQSFDALLISMKEGDESWASICQALSKSKEEVKARYKELATSDSSQIPTEDDAPTKMGANGRHDSSKKKGKAKGAVSFGKTIEEKIKTEHTSEKKKKISRVKRNRHKETARQTAETLFASHHVGCGNIAGDGESERGDRSEHSFVTVPPAVNPHRHPEDHPDSDVAEQEYLQKIREELYPPYLSFEPDPFFTEWDCRVLATIDSKMKRSRWLEMQANFCNVTGMMVPIEYLKKKTETAEDAALAEERSVRAQSWVDDLPSEYAPYDGDNY